jgi:quercetin dioxygenase-like cupin family protein
MFLDLPLFESTKDDSATTVSGLDPTSSTASPGREPLEPRSAAVSFVTTEHFALQGARSATIAESVGRSTMFLTSVSAGLVALGLVATAEHVGTPFYAFGLTLLPTLTFVGLVTFERAVQSGVEDYGYAVRIGRLRAYYFDSAPEITPYLASVSARERLALQGLPGGVLQRFRTVAGMVGAITAVLAGSTAGLAGAAASSSLAALASGIVVGVGTLAALLRYQHLAWTRAGQANPFEEPEGWRPTGAPTERRSSGSPEAEGRAIMVGITDTPVLTQPLPNVEGKTFNSVIVDFPPAARAAPHRHGSAFLYAYVLEGTVRSQLAGEPVHEYHQGQDWVELPGAHHLLTENTSPTEPAKLLVIFISDTGAKLKINDQPT